MANVNIEHNFNVKDVRNFEIYLPIHTFIYQSFGRRSGTFFQYHWRLNFYYFFFLVNQCFSIT